MNLRTLLIPAVAALLSAGLPFTSEARQKTQKTAFTCNYSDTDLTIYSPAVSDTVRLFVISDTHLFRSDSREDPYRGYSGRMAGAYNRTRHFRTGAETNPENEFQATLKLAKEFGADAVLHLGDLVSYPSEYAVEWALEHFAACGIPWYYIPGNHDWHYEGMEGSEADLRTEWCERRLLPLLAGHESDTDGYSVMIKGVNVILVSDGINEVLPSQVHFLKSELKKGLPSLLMMHIPLYTPGRNDATFTIGNPYWGAAVDRNYKVERRPQWPEHHRQADYDFYDTAINYGPRHGLLGIISGHVHFPSCSIQNGIPTLTVDDNASGGFLRITIVPAE